MKRRILFSFYSMLLIGLGTNLVAIKRKQVTDEPMVIIHSTTFMSNVEKLSETSNKIFFKKDWNLILKGITREQNKDWNKELDDIRKYITENVPRFLDEYNKLEDISNRLINFIKINYATNISGLKDIREETKKDREDRIRKIAKFIDSNLPALDGELKNIKRVLENKQQIVLTRLEKLWEVFKKVVPKQKKEVERKRRIADESYEILVTLVDILREAIMQVYVDLEALELIQYRA